MGQRGEQPSHVRRSPGNRDNIVIVDGHGQARIYAGRNRAQAPAVPAGIRSDLVPARLDLLLTMVKGTIIKSRYSAILGLIAAGSIFFLCNWLTGIRARGGELGHSLVREGPAVRRARDELPDGQRRPREPDVEAMGDPCPADSRGLLCVRNLRDHHPQLRGRVPPSLHRRYRGDIIPRYTGATTPRGP